MAAGSGIQSICTRVHSHPVSDRSSSSPSYLPFTQLPFAPTDLLPPGGSPALLSAHSHEVGVWTLRSTKAPKATHAIAERTTDEQDQIGILKPHPLSGPDL